MPFAPLKNDTFLRACWRQATDHTPVWLMRQAGRYLPEYVATRARAGSFMGLATNTDYATEVTLQPLARYPLDAAILFSDILIVPHAIGQELTFVAGEGPRLAPPLSEASLEGLQPVLERFEPIWATVARVKAALAPETTFMGFAGSPWTVATYMVAGQGSREQAEARTLAYLDPGKLAAIIERIEKERSASVTDSVPSALSLRPVKGKTSGPRWHWQLMFTRQT